jgi:hypothetical protein
MSEVPLPRQPRFKVGDRVHAIGPTVGLRAYKTGTVTEILGLNENAIFRYRVRFEDETSDTFFGFELELNGTG